MQGGTIDKDYPRSTCGYAFEIDEPAAQRILGGLPFFGLTWTVQSICKKDSTEISDDDRELLVSAVAQCPAKRIVVTHGTDTLIQSAQHIARSGAASGKAIAFTGAMKPERFVDSDATFNVGAAVAATGLLEAGSVVVVMGGQVIDCHNCTRNLSTGMLSSNRNQTPSMGPEALHARTRARANRAHHRFV
jgi:L-asparaginase